jgi:hypothetical protein
LTSDIVQDEEEQKTVRGTVVPTNDQQGAHGPVLGANLVAGEERVLAGQRDRSDLVLDRVCVELEDTVVEEADQAGPVRQGVADVLGELGCLRDARELGLEPGRECGDDRACVFAPGGQPDGRGLAAHGPLDLTEQRDLPQHRLGDGGALVLEAPDEAAADVRPATDQPPRAAVARDLGRRIAGLVGVALPEPAAGSGEELQRMRLAPAGGVVE